MKELSDFLAAIRQQLAQGSDVKIPKLGEFVAEIRELEIHSGDGSGATAKQRVDGFFRPTHSLREWFNGACKLPYEVPPFEHHRVTEDDSTAIAQFLDVCSQLVSKQITTYKQDCFQLWVQIDSPYESKNPKTGEPIFIPGKTLVYGGFLA